MSDEVEVPVFKKRSKATTKRKRVSDNEDDEDSASSQQVSVAELLRQRRHPKTQRSAHEVDGSKGSVEIKALQPTSTVEASNVDRMKDRFVAQTGEVIGLYDKQMNEYIEAKMAEYRNQGSQTSNQLSRTERSESPSTTVAISRGISGQPKTDKLSVTAGKLMEVDISGRPSKHEEEAAAKAAKPVKVRLGRDGKPWRPRKRRGSDDLARDALVDSIMKENSLSRFQDATPRASTPTFGATANTNEGYVDEDRVLENFKSTYQDPERRTTKKPVSKQDHSKGPKMGGSKNMRRAEEEKAKSKT